MHGEYKRASVFLDTTRERDEFPAQASKHRRSDARKTEHDRETHLWQQARSLRAEKLRPYVCAQNSHDKGRPA